MENNENFEESVIEERARLGNEKRRQKDTARLVWASKPRKEPSAKDLMFQTAEIVYPNRATGPLSSFLGNDTPDVPTTPNRLIWGDNLLIMQALLSQGYEGQIDLIYIDPPFNTGENFNFPNDVRIGNKDFERELPISERLAYTDTWERGLDSFLDMLYPRLQVMKRLLSNDGAIYVHCDQKASHYIKVVMDEIFGNDNFRNEIIVRRIRKNVRERERVPSLNVGIDYLLFYSKSSEHLIDPAKREMKKPDRWHSFEASGIRNGMDYELFGYRPNQGNHWRWTKERALSAIAEGILRSNPNTGKPEYFIPSSDFELRDSLWEDITAYSFTQGYPTEKKEELLELIIKSSSSENGLVADFFCGSGTTAAVAERIGRRWITTDLSKTAIQVTRSRLVNQRVDPFLIENLGNYQRQLIYLHEVRLREMYNIVLKLYGASPREDKQGMGISNTDRNTLVYVCEPDRPMTARKAVELSKDALALDGRGYRNVVILAWDYDYNYDEDLRKLSSTVNAKIESKIIPSDVYKYLRSTKVGDPSLADRIIFYQKPYLKVSEPEIIDRSGDEAVIKISIDQYVVMDNPIKDEDKRKEAEELLKQNYASLIDFWAVDWDYDSLTFKSTWQAIRNRRSKEPVITIADFKVKRGREYNIAVRVVDVFGNDASASKKIDLR
ncbi:MAG: site-specific DNA-methyltransferase [Candidatus Thermoplasmatota archaeon]|nr:site-specific DNA-methyltransferase [Candidatus Thermoplasmatota archaeon]MDA8143438.1 site-specific DNA-methyltransferase [Thermoplasmatales archaeon]